MDIWNLNNTTWTSFLLWRTGETKFRVVQQGQPLTFLRNPDYILMDKKYQSILSRLTDQLTVRPVTIIDEVRHLTFDNYLELKIFNEIEKERVFSMESKGPKIWKYFDECVFVSTDLKNEFEKLTTDDFEFTIGFSRFAGQNASLL